MPGHRRLRDLRDLRALQPNDLGARCAHPSSRPRAARTRRRAAARARRARGRPARRGPGARSRRRARRAASGPSDASVPAAPASWPGSEAPAPRSSACACCSSSPHDATFAPNVIGTACCPCVRPGMAVPSCRSASEAMAMSPRTRSPSSRASASRSCRTSPVSMMSCVVAPQCAHAPASPDSRDERADQRHQRVLRVGDAVAQGVEVVAIGLAGLGDRSRGLAGDHPAVGQREGERCLGIEPALHELRRVEDRPHRRRAEEVAQQRVVERRRHQTAPPSSRSSMPPARR